MCLFINLIVPRHVETVTGTVAAAQKGNVSVFGAADAEYAKAALLLLGRNLSDYRPLWPGMGRGEPRPDPL